MLGRVTRSGPWMFFRVLPREDGRLAAAWWAMVLLRGVLPAVFAVAMGALVGAVKGGDSLTVPLVVAGGVFVVLQMLAPVHVAVSANLGSRTAAWLYERLTDAAVAPPGM